MATVLPTPLRALSSSRPEDRISDERGVGCIVKKLRGVPHKDIEIARWRLRIGPYHRMVSHFDGRIGPIGRFVHACDHMHVQTRASIIGVPLLLLDAKRDWNSLHAGVSGILHVYRALRKRRDVVRVGD